MATLLSGKVPNRAGVSTTYPEEGLRLKSKFRRRWPPAGDGDPPSSQFRTRVPSGFQSPVLLSVIVRGPSLPGLLPRVVLGSRRSASSLMSKRGSVSLRISQAGPVFEAEHCLFL